MTKPVIYVIANKRAKMSAGKLAAQVGHATAGSFRVSISVPQNDWHKAQHRWLIVLEAQDDVHLMAIREYLEERGVHSYLIIDEGVNEVRPFTYTALGVQILDKDSPEAALLSGLKKYRDQPEEEGMEVELSGWERFKQWWYK